MLLHDIESNKVSIYGCVGMWFSRYAYASIHANASLLTHTCCWWYRVRRSLSRPLSVHTRLMSHVPAASTTRALYFCKRALHHRKRAQYLSTHTSYVSCHMCTRHITYARVVSHIIRVMVQGILTPHTNVSGHVWMSHVPWYVSFNTVTYEWVMSHVNESCHICTSRVPWYVAFDTVTCKWVTSHMNQSFYI